jgi:hypothetical protein
MCFLVLLIELLVHDVQFRIVLSAIHPMLAGRVKVELFCLIQGSLSLGVG